MAAKQDNRSRKEAMRRQTVSLVELPNGEAGKLVEFLGGAGLKRRLEAMGIRLGKTVLKRSGMFFRGPVVVQVDGTQVALGHGMAGRILVERVE